MMLLHKVFPTRMSTCYVLFGLHVQSVRGIERPPPSCLLRQPLCLEIQSRHIKSHKNKKSA